MKYYVYKITCNAGGNYKGMEYIGVKKHINPQKDPYMGGGELLNYFKDKLGIEYFTKEILYILDSSAEAYEIEKSLVDEFYIGREDTFNLCLGGLQNRRYDFACEWKQELKQYLSDITFAKSMVLKETRAKELRAIIQQRVNQTYIDIEL